jgi:hypothetical protein
MKAKFLKSIVVLLSLISIAGCGLSEDVSVDELESLIPESGPEIEQQSFCRGVVSTRSGNLNIRTSARITDNICGQLPSQAVVTVSLKGHEKGFLKIQTTLCEEGRNMSAFVSEDFITLDKDCSLETNQGEGEEQEESNAENEEEANREPDSLPILEDLANYIRTTLNRILTTRPLTRRSAPGRVEVFKLPGSGTNSICGSKHIRSYRSHPYLGKDTTCAWTAVTQEWRKEHCADGDSNCRIMLGDASFGQRQPSSWPHSTHRRGWCMDIWPMRKKNCGEKEVTWRDGCYDRAATQKFVRLLIKHGADVGNQLFFNDPQISETRRLRNHDDHIHVCFKPSNSIVKQACAKTKVDRKICSEFE